jgi:hypothetical protein
LESSKRASRCAGLSAMPRAGLPGGQKVEQEFSLQLVYRHGRLRKGVMSKTPKNKIVVLVIEDEALILDLMGLAGLDVPRKIRRGGFRNVHRHSAFNI